MKNILQTIFALIFLGGLVWGFYELIALLLEYLANLNNEVATAIIAGSTTLIISVMTVVLGKYYERKLTIEKSFREKKIPAYQNLVKFFFELLYE